MTDRTFLFFARAPNFTAKNYWTSKEYQWPTSTPHQMMPSMVLGIQNSHGNSSTQNTHQVVTRLLCYTDRVEIWDPACLRKGTARDNPGNTCSHQGSPPWGSPQWHDSSQWGIAGFRRTAFPLRCFSITRDGKKSSVKRKWSVGKYAPVPHP